MRGLRDLFVGVAVVVTVAASQLVAGARVPALQTPGNGSSSSVGEDNGIAVGDPKIFDNRALALMLDALNDSLRATTSMIDGAKLAATFGNLQGYQQDAIARSFSLQGAPLPGITDVAKLTGGTENISGGGTNTTALAPSGNTSSNVTTSQSEKVTSGTENSTTTTTAARSPQAPALPGFLSAPAFTPQFGMNGADLLGDQVNLSYQIVNLRLLLDRALTDRLIGNQSRLQAVLGFNVSIEPPRDSQDAAAFVEVTLNSTANNTPVSVVAMMPQEKTYNSAQLSNRANAFGGAAVSSVFSIGYQEQRQSQTFYLYRDNDTIAFERMNRGADQTTFGWSFRPVLGRRTVSPGARQMFAVISLPNVDNGASEIPLTMTIKTYWRHFDQKLKTSSESRTFWQNVARGASLGLAQDRPRGGLVSVPKSVPVPTTLQYQDNLKPSVEQVEWDLIGDSTAMVRVRGKNFFQGTEVRLGTARFTNGDGLNIKSDKAFDLIAPTHTLMSNGFVVGRYGSAVSLNKTAGEEGLSITNVNSAPPLAGRSRMDIYLGNASGGAITLKQLPLPALVRINDAVVAPPYQFNYSGKQLYLRLYVPEAMAMSGMVTVRFPFATDRWAANFRLYDPSLAFSLSRYAPEEAGTGTAKTSTTKLLITTNDFANLFESGCPAGAHPPTAWRLSLGKDYPVFDSLPPVSAGEGIAHWRSPRQIEFRAPTAHLDQHPLLLIDCNQTAHQITVPAAKPQPQSTTFATETDPKAVKINHAGKVTITGALLDRVTMVTANGLRLDSRSTAGGTKLEVFLTRNLTEHAGVVTLVCRDDKGTILGSVDLIVQ